MKAFEVEQKYRVQDPKVIRKRLRALGARRLSGGAEKNELWDLGTLLRSKSSVLRLRTFDGKGFLTFKGPKLRSKFKKRVEIETVVDPAAVKKMLTLLGFRVIAKYQKKREEYQLHQAYVTLDELERWGFFVEIEAPSRQIEKMAAKLGFGHADREERSYLEMVYGDRSVWRGK